MPSMITRFVWILVSLIPLTSIADPAIAICTQAAPGPPPTEWPRLSVTILDDVDNLGSDVELRVLARPCLFTGAQETDEATQGNLLPSSSPTPVRVALVAGTTPLERILADSDFLSTASNSSNQTSASENEQITTFGGEEKRKHWSIYIAGGLSRPDRLVSERVTGDERQRVESATKLDLGVRAYYILFENPESGWYAALYLGGSLNSLFGGGIDLGGSGRFGFELSPPGTGLALDVGFVYETLGDTLLRNEEATVTLGIRIPLHHP